MNIEIVPFNTGALPAAAELLAARHIRDRAFLSLLPGRFEQTRTAASAVREVWGKPNCSGVAAYLRDAPTEERRLVGYLIGEIRFDARRGRHVWIHLPGHALASGQSPDLYADLYAAAAPRWLEMGAFDHYIMMPACDTAGMAIWFSLSFGQEMIHAMRSLAGTLPPAVELDGVTLRRAVADDRNAFVEQMSPLMAQHWGRAPLWSAYLPEETAQMREQFAELLTDDNTYVWLAERAANDVETTNGSDNGRILGYQVYQPVMPSDDSLTIPMTDRAIMLDIGATQPEWRSRGIARALTAVGMAAAAAAGYRVCVVDWRTTNLEAQRFWPGMGFQPAAFRLVRKVDPRISWARY